MVEDLIKYLGSFSAFIVAFTWLTRSLIKHWLDKDLSSFKSSLKAQHELQLEKDRAQFRIAHVEHEVRFRHIHEKQAEIVAETYARLHELHKRVSSYSALFGSSTDPPIPEKLRLVEEANDQFREYYWPRKVFFDDTTCTAIESLSNKLAEVANKFTRGRRHEEQKQSTRSKRSEEDDDYWETCLDAVREEIPPLLTALRSDFQRILGVYPVAIEEKVPSNHVD